MLKIGLTGGIASGKSTVCALFERYSIPIIDADIIARDLVEPDTTAYAEIIHCFGNEIVKKDRTLNRKKLRNLIFSDPLSKMKLEKILHPKIRQQLILQSAQQHAAYCILAVPLLIESNMHDLVDRILVVDITAKMQLKRLQKRDHASHSQAKLITDAQSGREQRLVSANDIIENSGVKSKLAEQVDILHQKYISLANSCQHTDSQGQ